MPFASPADRIAYDRAYYAAHREKRRVQMRNWRNEMPDEYEVWHGMKKRCYEKSHDNFKSYGGRGISVCSEWRNSFETFLQDMGPRPTSTHTLERKRNNESYNPDNCIWATKTIQGRNTRANVVLTFNGIRQCVTAWAEETGLRPKVIYDRLEYGWSVKRALTEPVRAYRK